MSHGFLYQYDNSGQIIPGADLLQFDGERPSFGFWMNYLPEVVQLVRAHQAKDAATVKTSLAAVRAALHHKPTTRLPSFLAALSNEDRTGLFDRHQLPKDFITRSLPNPALLSGMRFTGLRRMAEALTRWAVPYTEVSYTAGPRQVSNPNLTYDIVAGQLNEDFNSNYDLLPPTFQPVRADNRNDLFAQLTTSLAGTASLEEVRLYDGSECRLEEGPHVFESIASLVIPLKVRAYPEATPPSSPSIQHELRPTRHTIKPRGSWFEITTASDGQQYVTVGDRKLPISLDLVARLKHKQVEMSGEGNVLIAPLRQAITVEYHRSGGELLPLIVDASVIQQRENYKPLPESPELAYS